MAEHGTFYWNEYLANDVVAVRTFYIDMLGWDAEDMEMPEGGIYTVFRAAGQPAAGLMDIRASQAPEGTPSHWFSYVAVGDVDASCKAAEAAGGVVMMAPFDIPGVGRIAVIRDTDNGCVGIMTPETGS